MGNSSWNEINTINKTLLDPSGLHVSLTGDELKDNIVFAVALQIVAFFVTDILAHLVYMRPRGWLSGNQDNNTLSYHAQARIATFDNFSRRVFRPSGFKIAPASQGTYKSRGRLQFVLVIFAVILGFIFQISATILGLPSNRPVFADVHKLVTWHVVKPKRGVVNFPGSFDCDISPVMDGSNIKPTLHWARCAEVYITDDSAHDFVYTNNIVYLTLLIQRTNRTQINGVGFRLDALNTTMKSLFQTRISFPSRSEELIFPFRSSFTAYRDYLHNFHLLTNVSGMKLKTVFRRKSHHVFVIDISKILIDSSATPEIREYARKFNAFRLIQAMIRGIFSYDGPGSTAMTSQYVSFFPYENRKVQVAVYNGTVLPAFYAVITAAVFLFLSAVVRLCLRDPPGLSWEVITAHGRKCCDKLLSGSDTIRRFMISRNLQNPSNIYAGYTVPSGFEEISERNKLTLEDIVEAAPLYMDSQSEPETETDDEDSIWR